MLARARTLSRLSLLALAACGVSEPDDSTGTAANTSTTATTTVEATSTTATTAAEPTGTTAVDACPNRPSGAYNACEPDGLTDTKLCGWTSDGGPASITCLGPQSGSFNICSLRDCVDECDCFAPPTTGTAIPGCRPIFGDGGKACTLYCLNGQICPDGMTCVGGSCYWPN